MSGFLGVASTELRTKHGDESNNNGEFKQNPFLSWHRNYMKIPNIYNCQPLQGNAWYMMMPGFSCLYSVQLAHFRVERSIVFFGNSQFKETGRIKYMQLPTSKILCKISMENHATFHLQSPKWVFCGTSSQVIPNFQHFTRWTTLGNRPAAPRLRWDFSWRASWNLLGFLWNTVYNGILPTGAGFLLWTVWICDKPW